MYPSPQNTLNSSLWIGHWNLSPGSTTFLRLRVLFLTTCSVYLDFSQALYMHMSKKKFSKPARRSNQSILKEISPGISLEGMMLKLKLQYFGHLMRRVDSL